MLHLRTSVACSHMHGIRVTSTDTSKIRAKKKGRKSAKMYEKKRESVVPLVPLVQVDLLVSKTTFLACENVLLLLKFLPCVLFIFLRLDRAALGQDGSAGLEEGTTLEREEPVLEQVALGLELAQALG